MLDSFLLVESGLLVGLRLLELALLRGHHKLSEVGVLAHFHVLSREFLLTNVNSKEHFLQNVSSRLIFHFDYLRDNLRVEIPFSFFVRNTTLDSLFLSLRGEEVSSFGTNELEQLQEVLIIEAVLTV